MGVMLPVLAHRQRDTCRGMLAHPPAVLAAWGMFGAIPMQCRLAFQLACLI